MWLTIAMSATGVAAVHAKEADVKTLDTAEVLSFDSRPVNKTANGSDSRGLIRGLLKSGEAVSVHETVQPAGAPPVELHAIQHSEFIAVCEGEVVYEHDGKAEVAKAGDVIYVPVGTVHRVRNTGSSAARYVVVAIGVDQKK
jgi:quercetin dioxygenase-like cupin family protein